MVSVRVYSNLGPALPAGRAPAPLPTMPLTQRAVCLLQLRGLLGGVICVLCVIRVVL